MSPQSRRHGEAGNVAPPNALFDEFLHAARELLAVRSPLDAELLVSDLLGTWWPQRHHTIGGAGVEQLVGEGLVEYAAGQRSPAALALLSGIACLGTSRQAAAAEQAAITLIDAGVRTPRWADHLGMVTAAKCYVNPDEWGDQDELICVYSYDGEEPHALVCVIDYNSSGMIKDGWVSSQVDKLLDHCQRVSAARKGARPEDGFREIDPPQARKMLEAALAATDDAEDPLVSDSFAARHAFIRSRIRALPPSPGRGARAKRSWTTERRALLAAEFLASDEAEELSDRQGRQPLRRPHHRLRLRPGQRPPAADVAVQGAELHADLAAAQGGAVGRRPERDAARGQRLDPLVRPEARAGRGRHRADARHALRLDVHVHPDLPGPGRARHRRGARRPAAA